MGLNTCRTKVSQWGIGLFAQVFDKPGPLSPNQETRRPDLATQSAGSFGAAPPKAPEDWRSPQPGGTAYAPVGRGASWSTVALYRFRVDRVCRILLIITTHWCAEQ